MRPTAATAVAAVVSGAPSTLAALAARHDPLEATRAAGSLVGRRSVVVGAAVHVVVSLWWGAVIGAVVESGGPGGRARGAAVGIACGAAIAALDLELVGRHLPAIAALDRRAQWLDHLAFGGVVGALCAHGTAKSGVAVGGPP